MDDYSRATGSDTNVDEFMARMTRDDVIPDEVRRRCVVEATRVRNSVQVSNRLKCGSYSSLILLSLSLSLPSSLQIQTNIEVKMMARDRTADADFCHTSSKDFADKINSDSTTDATATSTLPVEASFASAAAAAPLVIDDQSAAPGLVASCLAVLAAALMAAFF